MSTVEEAFRAQLLADPTVLNLVGDRIATDWGNEDPAGDRAVITRVTYEGADGLEAAGSLVRFRLQLDVYSKTKDGAKALAGAVDAVLHYQAFKITPAGGSEVDVRSIRRVDGNTGHNPRSGEFRQRFDYLVWGIE